eukprot:11560886-Alexandrium_andersonii.AAC.1
MLVHRSHAQIKGPKHRNIIGCGIMCLLWLRWDRPVGFDDIQTVEERLQCNIRVLDIEHTPVLSETSNMYKCEQFDDGECSKRKEKQVKSSKI